MSIFNRRWIGSSAIGVGAVALGTLLGTTPSCSSAADGGGGSDMAGADLQPAGGLALTSSFPASGPAAGGNTVNIVGTGFAPGVMVAFGDQPATGVQLLSKTQLSAVVPASATGNGPVTLTVKNPDGGTVVRGDLYS